MSLSNPNLIRNVAVVAHIDHGKTTLMDAILREAQVFAAHETPPERVMDSGDQERERGITIFSKHCSLQWKEYHLNLIDTPGHADFAGEVERVLGLVDSVLLVVDAKEGPMPQTRFVLKKALEQGLRPLVILNKIDRPQADPDRVLNATFDLFVELGATDDQLDFAYCYASALKGYAHRKIDEKSETLAPLLDLIVEWVPPPRVEPNAPFLMQVATVTYDSYIGRLACGRILGGEIRTGQEVLHFDREGEKELLPITRVEGFQGLQRISLEKSGAGEIVLLAGVENVQIGDTLSSPEHPKRLPPIPIEEPTLSVNITINSSPFSGREGSMLTMSQIRDRLEREKRSNITYRIDLDQQEAVTISGRGELHLAVLIETLRREGFELSMAQPEVVTEERADGLYEPLEEVHIELPEEYGGGVIERLSSRRGELRHLETDEHGISQLDFLIPTRGLLGFRSLFLTMTRGKGTLTSIFSHLAPWKGTLPGRQNGVMVSMTSGKTTAYALHALQARGTLFVGPGEAVYEGMIVGEQNRPGDLVVNPVKGKQLTNVRASGTDEALILSPPRRFTLEQAIDFIQRDEWIEVTPESIRLRKRHLKESDRKRAK